MIFRSRVDTGLRSTPVGAEQTSTGRLAPHSAVLTVLERVPIRDTNPAASWTTDPS